MRWAAMGPGCVKTCWMHLKLSLAWIACVISKRKRELLLAVTSALVISLTIKRLDSRPDHFKPPWSAKKAHHSFEVVREHMKAHLGAYPR